MGCACCGAKYKRAQVPKPAAPSILTPRKVSLYRNPNAITPPPVQPAATEPLPVTPAPEGQSEET